MSGAHGVKALQTPWLNTVILILARCLEVPECWIFAGLLESFTYTPTDPKTPSYFKVNKAAWHSDEQANQFTRTGRVAIPQEDDDEEDGHVDEAALDRHSAGCTNDRVAPVDVVGFACYDDSPRVPGSAMDMVQQDLSDSDSDAADRIFGAPPPVVEQNSDDEKTDMLDRIFGGGEGAGSSEDGSESAKEGVLSRIFGDSGVDQDDSEAGSDAELEGLADRIFGGSAEARPTESRPTDDAADAQSPSVKDRVQSFEDMFGGGDSPAGPRAGEDELEANRALLTSRIFGDVLPADGRERGDVDDELDNARAALTTRIFGDAEPSATDAEDWGVSDDMEMQREKLTHRIFGDEAASDSAGGAYGSAEAVDDDDRARLDLTDRLFGTNADSAHAGDNGAVHCLDSNQTWASGEVCILAVACM